MPFSIFKNPFEKPKKRKTDDAELVGELLGPEEEAEMREAMGAGSDSDRERDDTIRLSEEEEAAKKEVEEEVTPEQRREEYIKWAEEIGKDEDWVNRTFIFNEDGGVEVEGDLNLLDTNVTRFPKGLKSIGGDLDLRGCTGLTSLEGMPASIGGNLNLWGCTGLTSLEGMPASIGGNLNLVGCTGLTSLEGMPASIGGDLDLEGCTGLTSLKGLPASIGGYLNLRGCTGLDDIPKGINIGVIYLDRRQTELKANAEAKGYKVEIVE